MQCDLTQFCEIRNYFYLKKKEKVESGERFAKEERLLDFASLVCEMASNIAYPGHVGRSIFLFDEFQRGFSKICEEWNDEHGYYDYGDIVPKVYDYLIRSIHVGENCRSSIQEGHAKTIKNSEWTEKENKGECPPEFVKMVKFKSGDFRKIESTIERNCLRWRIKDHPSDIVNYYVEETEEIKV